MDPVRQNAIVLGGINYSDSSRVVWVLTPDYGRQSLMVKGGRRAGSKYLGRLETFSLVRVIYRKSGKGSLYTLREIDLEEPFAGIRTNLDAFWTASRAVELVKAVSSEEQESRDLFELLKGFLFLLGSGELDDRWLKPLLAAFRWRLTSILGMEPWLVECVRCGEKLTRAANYMFLTAEGGVVCGECGGYAKSVQCVPEGGTSLSYGALRFI
ncbi:MAG: DNA repair protein RecO, partial [Gemmatimonadota bacterium]|nr:DNA repair protein RecO [Gemmatimonadota bacterium]